MKTKIRVLLMALPFTVALAAAHGVNESVHVGRGEDRDRSISSVNGGVTVEDGATIRGSISSVNGGVKLGSNIRAESVSSVNGGVRIGDDVAIRGDVSSVNGSVEMGMASRASEVSTVNGKIALDGSEISGDLTTVNGDIRLDRGASVRDIIIKETRGRNDRRDRPQKIELEDGSEVRGDIIVEDPDVWVEVHIRGGSRVLGRVEGAKVIRD